MGDVELGWFWEFAIQIGNENGRCNLDFKGKREVEGLIGGGMMGGELEGI